MRFNNNVQKALAVAGVRQWELTRSMGYNGSFFSKKMRNSQLDPDFEAEAMKHIELLSQEQKGAMS